MGFFVKANSSSSGSWKKWRVALKKCPTELHQQQEQILSRSLERARAFYRIAGSEP